MKKIFSLIFIAFSIASSAQEKSKPSLYFGLEASPNVGYRILKTTSNLPSSVVELRNSEERPVQNISFAFYSGVQLSNHFELGTGIRYALKGYQVSRDVFFADTLDPNLPDKILIIQRARFVEIPIQATYLFYSSQRKYFVTAEVYWNSFIDQSVIWYKIFPDRRERNKDVNDANGLSLSYLGFGLSGGVHHDFNEKLALRVSPSFRMDIRELKNKEIAMSFWNGSINFGLYYKL